jgi:hypothetical protein
MTQLQFIAKCNELAILPELVLENDEIIEALKAKNDALVIELLNNLF